MQRVIVASRSIGKTTAIKLFIDENERKTMFTIFKKQEIENLRRENVILTKRLDDLEFAIISLKNPPKCEILNKYKYKTLKELNTPLRKYILQKFANNNILYYQIMKPCAFVGEILDEE